MDRTFDLRSEMAEQAAIEDLEAVRERLPRTLNTLWANKKLSAAERKATVLRLWDDLDPGPLHLDTALARAMESALDTARHQVAAGRKQIIDSVSNAHSRGEPSCLHRSGTRQLGTRTPSTRRPQRPPTNTGDDRTQTPSHEQRYNRKISISFQGFRK